MKLTPMLEQYLRVKQEHPEALLLFRLGDFYELFFEDAERAARLLDITLTTRSKKDDVPIPMCGVPYHSVQPYITKLLAAGLKVALCDQVGDTANAKCLPSSSNRATARGRLSGSILSSLSTTSMNRPRIYSWMVHALMKTLPWVQRWDPFPLWILTIPAIATTIGWRP
jgi:DNA mismatch repair protein MutS